MNKKDRGILYGMLLGDGCLNISNTQSPYTAKLVIGHSPKQKEYLQYKTDILNSMFGGRPAIVREYKSFNKKMQKEYSNIQMHRTERYFRQMHKILYSTGNKKFTRQALNYLTDEGLAFWYMDDGSGTLCKNKNGTISGCMTRISTYCSLEEIEIIRDWFYAKGIEIKFDEDKRNNLYSIRMNTKDSHKFIQIVLPYIHESMMYKTEHVKLYSTSARHP